MNEPLSVFEVKCRNRVVRRQQVKVDGAIATWKVVFSGSAVWNDQLKTDAPVPVIVTGSMPLTDKVI